MLALLDEKLRLPFTVSTMEIKSYDNHSTR